MGGQWWGAGVDTHSTAGRETDATRWTRTAGIRWLALAGFLVAFPWAAVSQNDANAAILQKVDAAVQARDDNIAGYTVTEHYRLFRGQDLTSPVAEMVVATTYRKDAGKSYKILSQSGSEVFRSQVLDRVLENEKTMNEPANRPAVLITSANYTMTVKGMQTAQGRNCVVVSIDPKRAAPYLFKGNIWVDPKDGSIVQLGGVESKSPSFVAGQAEVSRQYASINGFSMATHATASSHSFLLGQTTIEIEYSGYNLVLTSRVGGNPPKS